MKKINLLPSLSHILTNSYITATIKPEVENSVPCSNHAERGSFLFDGHNVCFWKKGSGEPLIFLHNAGNDHHIWDYQLEYFSKTHEVFLIDDLGYGESDKPKIDYTLPLYSDMLSAFIEEKGFESVSLVGQCIGAAMSLYYTLNNPQKVKSLILFNVATVDGLNEGTYGVYYKLTRNRLLYKFISPFINNLILPGWKVDQEINKQYGDTGDPNKRFKEHILNLYKDPAQIRTLANLASNFDTFNVLDDFTKPSGFPPVFLIWGNQNKVLPEARGKDFCEKLSPDYVEFIEDCGHLVMREKHEKINSLIDLFITKDNFTQDLENEAFH